MPVKNIWGEVCPCKWEKCGETTTFDVQLQPGVSMTTTLGKVKQKKDGRWEWFLVDPSRHVYNVIAVTEAHKFVPCQGVKATKDEAMKVVEDFWLREVADAVK